MPKPKSAAQKGLETILNDSRMSPFANPGAFRQMLDASNLPVGDILRHVGSKKRAPKQMEEDKSKARVEKLEADSETH